MRDEDVVAFRVIRTLAAVTSVVLAVAFLALMLVGGRPAVLSVATFLSFGLVYGLFRFLGARSGAPDDEPDA